MYNLLVSFDEDSWNISPYTFDKQRFCEYTVKELKAKYTDLSATNILDITQWPTLFTTEHESSPSRIGYITRIKNKTGKIEFSYEIDPVFPALPIGTLDRLKEALDISKLEMYRTHWAIKDEDLFKILIDEKIITGQQVAASEHIRVGNQQATQLVPLRDQQKVFIVHGHDNLAKTQAARLIEQLGLKPVILHEQASSGRTIIEKIEAYTDVGFALVLYTPCDVGAASTEQENLHKRARQNVVFEHGYLIAKLGRAKVTALVKGSVETPNDISGVVYTKMDDAGAWKNELCREMKSAGYAINIEALFGS